MLVVDRAHDLTHVNLVKDLADEDVEDQEQKAVHAANLTQQVEEGVGLPKMPLPGVRCSNIERDEPLLLVGPRAPLNYPSRFRSYVNHFVDKLVRFLRGSPR